MEKKNSIKYACMKIRLSDAAKVRIVNACGGAEEKGAPRRVRWSFVAAAAALTVLLTVGTLAAAGVFRRAPGDNKAHIGSASDPAVVDVMTDGGFTVSDDGKHLMTVNAVTGGRYKVYIDCTLTRKDGGVITDRSSDGAELPVFRAVGTLKLSNGEETPVNFFTLSDSTETEYHLEGMALVVKPWKDGADEEEYRKNKYYSAEEMKELLDGAKLTSGVVGASYYRTEETLMSPDLAGALALCEPGSAIPDMTEENVYGNEGNAYLRESLECTLGEGGMDIPFSSDGSVTVDNYGFGPYHHHRADGSEVTALYLNLKGYEGVTFGAGFKFYPDFGDEVLFCGFATGNPAPGVTTFALHDEMLEDMTLERLAEACRMSGQVYEENVIAVFSRSVVINGDFKNAVVEKGFDSVTIPLENGQIVLDACNMTNTEIKLFGSCTGADSIDLPLEKAYAVTDSGQRVMLGGKCGTGTNFDGVFEIIWQCETVLDPETISEIHIGDAVIKLK